MNFLIPILLICRVTSGDCSDSNSVDKIILEPVATPSQCIIAGSVKQVEYISQHPGIDVEFRVRCVNPNRQKT